MLEPLFAMPDDFETISIEVFPEMIKGFKKEINRLKKRLERINGALEYNPDDSEKIKLYRDYLKKLISAYTNAGGEYKKSRSELSEEAFNQKLTHITQIEFEIGGYFGGFSTRVFTIDETGLKIEAKHSLLPDDKVLCFDNSEKEQFLMEFKNLFIGEWKQSYDNSDVLDGTRWALKSNTMMERQKNTQVAMLFLSILTN